MSWCSWIYFTSCQNPLHSTGAKNLRLHRISDWGKKQLSKKPEKWTAPQQTFPTEWDSEWNKKSLAAAAFGQSLHQFNLGLSAWLTAKPGNGYEVSRRNFNWNQAQFFFTLWNAFGRLFGFKITPYLLTCTTCRFSFLLFFASWPHFLQI